jgi:hypothetical protein
LDKLQFARDLYAVHGLLPVPVAGKVPISGTGWNLLDLDTRLRIATSNSCTGIGIQFGLIFHPVLGPVEARCIDCDIDDPPPRNAFMAAINVDQWRWGRRPAMLVFTEPNVIKREKFGPVQLLGAGKQAVWIGAYINSAPRPDDPKEYWHSVPSIFDRMPPHIPADLLRRTIETALASAGVSIAEQHAVDATPLSADDLASLDADSAGQFAAEIKSMLIDVQNAPTGTGRGTKLHHLGVKYGALIKASGHAPMLMDGVRSITPADKLIEYDTVKKHAFLSDIGRVAEDAFIQLPGTLGAGDKRDFARGVGMSAGYGQRLAIEKKKHALLMPTGREHPGQTASDLLRSNLPPITYMVNNILPDTGCIILAGKPKAGKSWIVLDLALAVIRGTTFWGQQVKQGGVLMYMMEDGPRRISNRLKTMQAGVLGNETDHLRFRYSADGPFYVDSNGTGTLLDDMTKHMVDFPGTQLIVVDVLQRVRGTVERSDNAYQVDYKFVAAMQKLAVQYGILILVVHHTKKGKVEDAIDSISGSFGVIGAADGGIVVGKEGNVLRVQSMMRDIPDFDLELTKEEGSPVWKPVLNGHSFSSNVPGGSDAAVSSGKGYAVLHILAAAACELTIGDVARRLNDDEKQIAVYLSRLTKSGQAVRTSRGFYMASGLPRRERAEGVINTIKSMLFLTPVTSEIEAKYAPDGAPEGAVLMTTTDKMLMELKACFFEEKKTLDALQLRGSLVYNSDTVWLIGPEWTEQPQQMQFPNPFAQVRMPWE